MPLLITQVKESQFMILLTQLYQYKQSKLTKLYDNKRGNSLGSLRLLSILILSEKHLSILNLNQMRLNAIDRQSVAVDWDKCP